MKNILGRGRYFSLVRETVWKKEQIVIAQRSSSTTCSAFVSLAVLEKMMRYCHRSGVYIILSHNNPCFRCNIAITNFLVSHTCYIRFYDIIHCTVHYINIMTSS